MLNVNSKTALIVVDMQHGFLDQECAMQRLGFDLDLLRVAIEPCRRAVVAAREAGIPIIWTRYVYKEDYSDGGIMVELLPGLRDECALKQGSHEVEVFAPLDPRDEDIYIDKNRPSAFFNTDLDQVLADNKIEQLLVCGITTNCCVESTVRDAAHRDIPTFVISDAVAETDIGRHDYALRAMGMLFARLVTIDDVERAVRG
jgi:ureidoacrylate peracid hydrolase